MSNNNPTEQRAYKLVPSSHPALRQVAAPVEVGDAEVSSLVDAMFDTIATNSTKGIGLAANQLGVLKRVIVIHCDGFKQEFINPVIVYRGGGKKMTEEGCLSFPGRRVKKVRDRSVVVEGLDKAFNPIRRRLKEMTAICVQHEVDHLNGVTIA